MKIRGGREAKFQIDTGATCNVIKACEITGTKYANQVTQTTQMPKMFNSTTLRPIGKCKIQVYNPKSNQKHKVTFMVIPDETCTNLIGSQATQQMGFLDIHFEQLHDSLAPPKPQESRADAVETSVKPNKPSKQGLSISDILNKYPDVFEGLGELGPELQLEVEDYATPIQLSPGRIPEALKQLLKQHLDKLREDGIIEKVNFPTDWISATVVAKKSNGDIHLCLDPKPLNKVLKRCKYPLPVIEEVLPELGKAKVFTKVDYKNGYWQVKLNETSSLLTTFATPFGRYKWKCMPFSIAPAGEIFQSRLDQAIEGLDGVKTVADDILVIGNGDSMTETIADHDRKLTSLLTHCREW